MPQSGLIAALWMCRRVRNGGSGNGQMNVSQGNVAMNRLQEHALRLPAKPIVKLIDYINDVWRKQDNHGDLLDDNEWQTLMN
jgi:hypothetical protein